MKFFFWTCQQLSVPNQRHEADGQMLLQAEGPKACGDTYPVFRVHVISGESWHFEAVSFGASPLRPISLLNNYHLLRYPNMWIGSFLVYLGISFGDGSSVMAVGKERPWKTFRSDFDPGGGNRRPHAGTRRPPGSPRERLVSSPSRQIRKGQSTKRRGSFRLPENDAGTG